MFVAHISKFQWDILKMSYYKSFSLLITEKDRFNLFDYLSLVWCDFCCLFGIAFVPELNKEHIQPDCCIVSDLSFYQPT